MGKGNPRAVEKVVLGQNLSVSLASSSLSSSGSLHVPSAPVYYPNEEEFRNPLEYIERIRCEAEKYGICKIVPPRSWTPPFALNLDEFNFPTKTQAIHQLQARNASCDSKTFRLEYGRFLEGHCRRKLKKRVVFEGEDLDLCKLFNAVKRFGGYDKVVKEKKWGDVSRFVRLGKKVSECAKHVLCQLYREHLFDYEEYCNQMNKGVSKGCKRGVQNENKRRSEVEVSCSKRRRKNNGEGEKVRFCEKEEKNNGNDEKVRVSKNVEKNKDDDEKVRVYKKVGKNNGGDKVRVCKKVEKNNGDGDKVRVDKKEEEKELDQVCEQCRSGLHGEVMLLCDRCNKGWHIYCLSPPLKRVPAGNWYCFECLNSDKDSFGFVPGKRFTVETFRRVADRAKRKWFGSSSASRVQMEKKFWEIVEGLAGEVEVMYGSDLDTSIYGSGFPRVNDQRPEVIDAKIWDEYCCSPWNLNNLPKLKGSMLQAVHQNITGVMVPWLYVGMLFSSFCWHFEDHCFYSMNYLHWGEPKCWYSVPGGEANAFEKVMRNSLPDLFDAQPDLLFQLVTMFNPSVLQENGVSVYSMLQEPGNFVITFPRSYHGGFNFGLNCAEAVNFAPADWLPHGGFGAKLYQMYHKTAVLSHEELLCVVAKGDCNSKVAPHLRKELLRIYSKEKTWRERLWRSGIIKSSLMPPRKCPEYVGTEEDPTCIICKQYLYLSAVVCRCRPSAYVCLEHWEHICECKSSRLRLLYRHTLAEIYDLVLKMDKYNIEEKPQSSDLQRQISCSSEPNALAKKVQGGTMSMSQLAEQWLLRSCKIFQSPYADDAYTNLLKDAEQFLWAGSEMDPVRVAAKKLIVSQKWVEGVRDCLTKIQNWCCSHDKDVEKVHMDKINELLKFDPVPCDEPGHLKLKEHAEEARLLIQEIGSALSSCLKISELESLSVRASKFPIYVKESEKLSQKISLAKVWMDSARKCISGHCSAAVDVDTLYKLKSEMLELQVQLPEAEILMDLLSKAELCQAKCSGILRTSMSLKDAEALIQEFDNFTVNISELVLLKQHYTDALSWSVRCNDLLMDVHEREDQDNVVNELSCLLKDGASLRIQVDKLAILEVELKKASCRERALKARDTKMPLDYIQQVMDEAAVLQIEGEKVFVDISGVLAVAKCWEERAKRILAHGAQMADFEDILRSSADIFVILPSLDHVKDAVAMANFWLKNAEAFLVPSSSMVPGSCSLLKLKALKELILQLKLLKISLNESGLLEVLLKKCEEWQQVACSALQDAECLFSMSYIGDGRSNELVTKIECLVTRTESIIKTGSSLGFDFPEILKLQNACSMLQWCARVLSFCSVSPSFEDVESLTDTAENLSATCVSGTLWNSLVDGVQWLRKALDVISMPSNFERTKLNDAEELLSESKDKNVSFPVMNNQLLNAIEKHKLWQGQVDQFFSLKFEERSWSGLVELKEHGMAAAFSCSALDMVISEVEKVQNWKQQCIEILGKYINDGNPLIDALHKIKQLLDLSLYIYGKSRSCEAINLCMWCTDYTEEQELLSCSMCKDCYHLRCLEPVLGDANVAELYICPYCLLCERGAIFQNGSGPLKFGGRLPELRLLIGLVSEAENFCIAIEEREALRQVVKQAFECQTCLREILVFALSCLDKDLSVVSKKLIIALKATQVAGVSDHQDNCDLELALARNSWRVKVNLLLEAAQKPSMQQVQWHIKEGLAINIHVQDHFWQKLTELRHIGLQWASHAKKVASDSGALGLDKVFELILEGERLPVYLEEELKLLQARSMLYCICRKPYDDRPKVFCDQCDEWYHIDCIKLHCRPKIYLCAACKPEAEQLYVHLHMDCDRSTSAKFVEPKTPSPRHSKLIKKSNDAESCVTQKLLAFTNNHNKFSCSSGIDQLCWRSRKPFRRVAKKRTEMGSLSPFFQIKE